MTTCDICNGPCIVEKHALIINPLKLKIAASEAKLKVLKRLTLRVEDMLVNEKAELTQKTLQLLREIK